MSYNRAMLADILFGNYRKKALGLLLLSPSENFHVRELARQTQTSAGTLHKELSRLATAGLLLRQAQGNQVRYQANVQCPIYSELASIMRKTTGVAQSLQTALEPLQPKLAVLFGSMAAGLETSSSDVDVLIVTEHSFADVITALYSAQQQLGREINPVVMDAKELEKKRDTGDALLNNIRTQPKIVLWGDVHELG
jgi:predicted nucleotidyltransferase